MSPRELLRAIEHYLAAPDPAALPVLIQDIQNLADMVGWAKGPIDPEGRLTETLAGFIGQLRARYEAAPSDGVAALHDSLGQLADAVARHDRDLDAGRADDDEEV